MKCFSLVRVLLHCFVFYCFLVSACYAKQYARPIGSDSHIKVITYDPSAVHVHVGFPGVICSIVFEEGESITSLAMGDSTGWNILPQGNRLMVRPFMDPSDKINTNALLITNKRVYLYEFVADRASGLDDPKIAYQEVFVYPGVSSGLSSQLGGLGGEQSSKAPLSPLDVDMSDLPNLDDGSVAARGLNFKYTYSRTEDSATIVPIRVFDDGHFTYIEFPKRLQSLPTVFEVDPRGYESLLNIRSRSGGRVLIVEKVVKVMTLRDGAMTVCLFNAGIDW